ncbi:MAG: hypothetical protein K0V04_39970, partial [Deltaproteobacteria bacterium]|nr:hypothetical protein [Deltaproteobacteria bacterium]
MSAATRDPPVANVDPSAQSGDHAELRGTAPRAGSVLADRYRLVRQLGSGGMGSVWEAEHTQLGTTVAVKLIKPQLLDNPRARERFVREARSAAGLRSPYVVQIFD